MPRTVKVKSCVAVDRDADLQHDAIADLEAVASCARPSPTMQPGAILEKGLRLLGDSRISGYMRR